MQMMARVACEPTWSALKNKMLDGPPRFNRA